LRYHGIDVELGDGAEEAAQLNHAYIHHRTTGAPFVTLKMAQSMDGFVARRRGERTQLSGPEAAKLVRNLRFEHDAVMIGVGTAIADDPELTVRPRKARAVLYRRIVVDSHGRIPLRSKLVRDRKRADTIVATTSAMPPEIRSALEKHGVSVLTCRATDGKVDIRDMLAQLGKQGLISILCEGGPTLAGALLRARCVGRIHWLIAPLILGSDPNAGGSAGPVSAVAGAPGARIRIEAVRTLGQDVLVSGIPEDAEPSSQVSSPTPAQ
jgi:diaminohydroxyphosphoribosylaminopyrimidine deaminase/5-amino-6-(5-phosphoribosylamino)uracil reductase